MSATTRLALPYLVPGQAQKELYHNEALQLLDMLVAPAIEGGPGPTPPEAPDVGACYLVGEDPTAEWAGKSGCLARYTSGGWRFVEPIEGISVFVRDQQCWATYCASSWELGLLRCSSVIVNDQQVVGRRLPGIAAPSGGGQIDTEARRSIGEILAALREHGLIEI